MRSAREPGAERPDPFAGWDYPAGEPSAEPTAEAAAGWEGSHARAPRSRALSAMLVVGVLGAAAVAFVLTQGGGGSAPLVSSPVTEAAYVTTRASGFKTAMTIAYTVAGQTLTLTANGAFNTTPSPEGSLTMVAPGGATITELIIAHQLYLQLPSGAQAFAAPTPWVKADLSAYMAASAGSSSSVSAGQDPSQDLNLLRATGQVSTVGTDTVRGVATTHYHAVIDLARYAAAVPAAQQPAAYQDAATIERVTGHSTLPTDVWVDLQGRVRRMALNMSICSRAGTIASAVTIDLYDYGHQASVVPPPPDQVTDITSQLGAGIASASSSSSASAQLGC